MHNPAAVRLDNLRQAGGIGAVSAANHYYRLDPLGKPDRCRLPGGHFSTDGVEDPDFSITKIKQVGNCCLEPVPANGRLGNNTDLLSFPEPAGR